MNYDTDATKEVRHEVTLTGAELWDIVAKHLMKDLQVEEFPATVKVTIDKQELWDEDEVTVRWTTREDC